MLKVVLINPPQFTKHTQPPMGLAILAAILEKEKYQVSVLDANALKLKLGEIARYTADADVIGITAMTPTINAALAIAREIKNNYPNLPIILGGAHATLLPEETLAGAPQIDFVVRGEGEETIVEILRALEEQQPLDGILSITYRKEGKVVSNPSRPMVRDLDSLPFLAYHLLPWQKYRPHPPHGHALPFAAIITSRGCPYHCAYCSKPVFGSTFRAQSPERVLEEISYYKERFGFKEIAFYDDVFTLNKKRAYAIADGLIKSGLKIHWTCETRVNLVDKELLEHLKRAGCYAIAYGIESASPEILKSLNKDITPEQAVEAVRLARQVGLQTIGYFMIGSPGESRQTVLQTIQFAKKLRIDFAQFAITTPFPGTRLYELYLNGKRDNLSWNDFLYEGAGRKVTTVFETNSLNRADLQHLTRQAYKQFYLRPSYLWQRLRQTTSVGDLKINLKGLAMLLDDIRG